MLRLGDLSCSYLDVLVDAAPWERGTVSGSQYEREQARQQREWQRQQREYERQQRLAHQLAQEAEAERRNQELTERLAALEDVFPAAVRRGTLLDFEAMKSPIPRFAPSQLAQPRTTARSQRLPGRAAALVRAAPARQTGAPTGSMGEGAHCLHGSRGGLAGSGDSPPRQAGQAPAAIRAGRCHGPGAAHPHRGTQGRFPHRQAGRGRGVRQPRPCRQPLPQRVPRPDGQGDLPGQASPASA
jgi:hypothetical protein